MNITGRGIRIDPSAKTSATGLLSSAIQSNGLRSTCARLALCLPILLGGCPSSDTGGTTTQSDSDSNENQGYSDNIAGSSQNITFEGADLTLEGTLEMPVSAKTGQTPAIVLVHGSGPLSRNSPLPGQLNMSFSFTVPVFKQISEALANAGYAVLRYDKRSCGTFNECTENDYPKPTADLTVYDFIADAEAALDYLHTRPEIDQSRVYLLGHSQGASFVPDIANRRTDVAGGIMLTPQYRPIDALLAQHEEDSRQLLTAYDVADDEIDTMLGYLPGAVDDLTALRSGSFTGESILSTPVGFWQSWMDVTDAAPGIASDLTVPLLLIGGSYDWNIPDEDRSLWAETLSGTGHEVTTLDCVTHALNCITQPDFMELTLADIGTTVHEPLVRKVLQFLDAH